MKLFTETVLAFNFYFHHIGLSLQENQVHHSKEPKTLAWLEKTFRFCIYLLYLYTSSALEGHGNKPI
jgi:hypothetical protein